MPAVVTAPLPQQADGYSVGTLRYTGMGLVVVFGWLLWGDFCFTLMEKVMPEIYPLFLLDRLGASNTTANIFMITIPQILVVVLCPAISFRSDRTRSRWGRVLSVVEYRAGGLTNYQDLVVMRRDSVVQSLWRGMVGG